MEREKKKISSLSNALNKIIIGQKEAVELIVNAIIRSRSGMIDPNRPIASLFFIGQTGVGKTGLCRALATELFNNGIFIYLLLLF